MNTNAMINQERSNRSIIRSHIHTEIVEYLVDDIRKGIYKSGQELPSGEELMAEFGVGRSSIREALTMLARMGLIEVRPGQRAKVRKPTVKPILGAMSETMKIYMGSKEGYQELSEFRNLFECMIVREVSKRIKKEQLIWMENSIKEQEQAVDDIKKFAELDVAFHRYLSECLNNTLLESFSESMTDWLLDQRKKSLQAPNQLQNALLDHKSIYAGLKKHDPDKAEKAMREHLYRVEQAYSSVVSFKK